MAEGEWEGAVGGACARAVGSARRTFYDIRGLLVASGCERSSARLSRVQTVIREGMESRRVPLNGDSSVERADIYVVIVSGDKVIDVRLDGCFPVD